MAIEDDYTLDYVNKIIYHSSGTTIYDSNDFYSWLMAEFTDSQQLDDPVLISAQTQFDYTMINGWYIGDYSIQFLKGGSIGTLGWKHPTYPNGIRIIEFGATYTNAVSGDIGNLVYGGTTGDQGILLDYNNTDKKWWVRANSVDDLFDVSETITVSAGTGVGISVSASNSGETLWSNIYTVGTLEGTPQLYILQGLTVINEWWSVGHLDVLIKVKEASNLIYSGDITIFCRNWTDYYDHTDVNIAGGGRNVGALATQDDSDNQSASSTIEDLIDGTTATISVSAVSGGNFFRDIGDGDGAKLYNVLIDGDGQTLSNIYEATKWITQENSTYNILPNQDGEVYIAASATYAPNKPAPVASYTGGTFICNRGVYLENIDVSGLNDYIVTDANNIARQPPILVAFTLTNLVSGSEIRIYNAGTQIEVAGIENSGTVFNYIYTYSGDFDVDIVVHHIEYVYQRFENVTLTNASQSLPIQQQFDRWYNNP